jgi:hypothetical protein
MQNRCKMCHHGRIVVQKMRQMVATSFLPDEDKFIEELSLATHQTLLLFTTIWGLALAFFKGNISKEKARQVERLTV